MASSERRPAVFLDRDGVLNAAVVRDGRPFGPPSVEEMRIIEGVPEACAALKAAGYLLVCVTNQPDVARGHIDRATVDGINARLKAALPLDEIAVCLHDDADRCDCRKPKPGLLLAAARRWNIDLERSFMVGDRWRDVEAGRAAGCRTVFVDHGYDEKKPERPDLIASSLADAVPALVAAIGAE
jgi:D-glycero-D-manno-heptose 1,7-bisphosphate phosphatase